MLMRHGCLFGMSSFILYCPGPVLGNLYLDPKHLQKLCVLVTQIIPTPSYVINMSNNQANRGRTWKVLC
jgi:hypothetical protein